MFDPTQLPVGLTLAHCVSTASAHKKTIQSVPWGFVVKESCPENVVIFPAKTLALRGMLKLGPSRRSVYS